MYFSLLQWHVSIVIGNRFISIRRIRQNCVTFAQSADYNVPHEWHQGILLDAPGHTSSNIGRYTNIWWDVHMNALPNITPREGVTPTLFARLP